MTVHAHSESAYSARGWRQRIAEAEKYVRRARVAGGEKRRALCVKASKIYVHTDEPTKHAREYGERGHKIENAIGKLAGCGAGCLAMETTPGERKTIARMRRMQHYWIPVCGQCLRAAVRPDLDGETEIDPDVRENCHICGVLKASHEWTPNAWVNIEKALKGRRIPMEEVAWNLGIPRPEQLLSVIASLASPPDAVVTIADLRIVWEKTWRSYLDRELAKLARQRWIVRVRGGARLGRRLGELVRDIDTHDVGTIMWFPGRRKR